MSSRVQPIFTSFSIINKVGFQQTSACILLALCPVFCVYAGIAYDHARKRIFVTGKNWPLLFEVAPKEAHEPDNAALRHVPHTLEHARSECIPR